MGSNLSVSPLGGHLSVPLVIWALQALAIRGGASELYPLIRTPMVLLVILREPVGIATRPSRGHLESPWLLGEPDGSSTVGLLTA